MKTNTRTAPAMPRQAVRTGKLAHQLQVKTSTNRSSDSRLRNGFDYGPIPRAEMRQIVLDMIG